MLYYCTRSGAYFEAALPLYRNQSLLHPYMGCSIAQAYGLLESCILVQDVPTYKAFLVLRGIQRVTMYKVLESLDVLEPPVFFEQMELPRDLKLKPTTTEIARFRSQSDILTNLRYVNIPFKIREISESTPLKLWQAISIEAERFEGLKYYENAYGIHNYEGHVKFEEWHEECSRVLALCPFALGRELTLTAMLYHYYIAHRSYDKASMERWDESYTSAVALRQSLGIAPSDVHELERACIQEPLSFRFSNAMLGVRRLLMEDLCPKKATEKPVEVDTFVTRSLEL